MGKAGTEHAGAAGTLRPRPAGLFSCVLDPEDLKFFFVQPQTAEHQTVAAQGFDRVDAHAAHHFLQFMVPGGDQIHQTLVADIRIQALYKIGALGGNAPVALAGLAGAA